MTDLDTLALRAVVARERERLTAERETAAEARAAQEAAERRLADLEAVGIDVDALAAAAQSTAGSLALAAGQLAAAAKAFRTTAAEHDAAVAALMGRARELNTEPAAPGGPRPSSGYVALARDGIRNRTTELALIGAGRVDAALQMAVAGDPARAAAAVVAVRHVTTHRADRYYRGSGGAIFGESGPAGHLAKQCEAGLLHQLRPTEVNDYLAGKETGDDTAGT